MDTSVIIPASTSDILNLLCFIFTLIVTKPLLKTKRKRIQIKQKNQTTSLLFFNYTSGLTLPIIHLTLTLQSYQHFLV